MNEIFIAFLIGITAGIIDVVPMIIQKLDRYACLAAFSHWVVLGLLIPFIDWDIAAWLKGLIIGELAIVPTLFMVLPQDKKALIPMISMSALLGIGVALAGAYFIA